MTEKNMLIKLNEHFDRKEKLLRRTSWLEKIIFDFNQLINTIEAATEETETNHDEILEFLIREL
jgi:hypothetical protein